RDQARGRIARRSARAADRRRGRARGRRRRRRSERQRPWTGADRHARARKPARRRDRGRAEAGRRFPRQGEPAPVTIRVLVVADGEALLAPTVTRRLLDRFARTLPDEKPPPALETLTARELEILRLVAGGLSNAEIADQLVVTEATVKTHVSSVLRKLQLRDRVQAVVLAYDAGLVQPSAR